jgi:excisionase family DNA binding protein
MATHTTPDDEVIDDLDLLTLGALATLFGVSKRTIENLVASGQIPSVKVGDWNRRVRRIDAREYLRKADATPTT